MRYQEIMPFLGPYEAKGRNGERYFVRDLRELYWYDPTFFYRQVRLEGAHSDSLIIPHGLPIVSLGSDRANDSSPGWVAAAMWGDVKRACLSSEGFEGDVLLVGVLGYFTLTHATGSTLLEGVSGWTVKRIVRAIARGDLDGARRVWQYEKRKKAQLTRETGRKRHFGGGLRNMATTAERRRNAADVAEHGADMVRGRRRHLPDAWWDFWRRPDKGWKQKKIRKQWMKHLPR